MPLCGNNHNPIPKCPPYTSIHSSGWGWAGNTVQSRIIELSTDLNIEKGDELVYLRYVERKPKKEESGGIRRWSIVISENERGVVGTKGTILPVLHKVFFLPWHYVYVVIIGTPQLKSARANCQWNHLSHLIRVPSGPNFHRWITPLKGVCRPVSCQQWPRPIMIPSWQSSRLHTQYCHGPLYMGIFNSEVPCMYYRIIWRKNLEFHCIIYAV